MRYKHEELAAARVRITNKEYQRTVLRGIPEELAKFASPLLSAARLTVATTSLSSTRTPSSTSFARRQSV
jgi:hypothetical protein